MTKALQDLTAADLCLMTIEETLAWLEEHGEDAYCEIVIRSIENIDAVCAERLRGEDGREHKLNISFFTHLLTEDLQTRILFGEPSALNDLVTKAVALGMALSVELEVR